MRRAIPALIAASLCLAALAFAPASLANDGVYGGSGVHPMPLTTSDVRMVEEHVVLRYDRKRAAWDVTCDFTFENTSKEAVTLTVGFPFPTVSEEEEENTATPAGKPEAKPGRPLVWDFETTVGGKKVPVRETKTLTNTEIPDVSYTFAYIWEVTFKPGERVNIRNTYTHGENAVSDGTVYANYVLKTGTLWKGGKIGRSRLEVHMPGARHVLCSGDLLHEPTAFTPAGGKTVIDGKGIAILWDLKDFAPTQDINVCYADLDAIASRLSWELRETDLSKLSADELRTLRNRVYALHGYVFKKKDMADLFAREWWYRPNPGYSASSLTPEEHAFVAKIQAEEKLRKSSGK
ncbi:MAG: YARHG domain-containing protein [Myxococcota bacterium]